LEEDPTTMFTSSAADISNIQLSPEANCKAVTKSALPEIR